MYYRRRPCLTYTVVVVRVFNTRNIKAFFRIQLLFLFQNPLVEEVLQLLVAVVDAELLERVHFKEF